MAEYTIHGHILQVTDNAKYLGVSLDSTLNWNYYVSQTAKKADSTRASIQRNMYSCPQPVKEACYQTLVRPIIEYAGMVWDPHTQANINRLEAVNRRAARFVTNDYSYYSSVSQMLQTLGWQTLNERRAHAKVTMVYRIVHQLVEIQPEPYLRPLVTSSRGHSERLYIPYCRSPAYQSSFFPNGARLWNQLPQHVVCAASVEAFKASLGPITLR